MVNFSSFCSSLANFDGVCDLYVCLLRMLCSVLVCEVAFQEVCGDRAGGARKLREGLREARRYCRCRRSEQSKREKKMIVPSLFVT